MGPWGGVVDSDILNAVNRNSETSKFRRTYKMSPLQKNISIQNVFTHNVSLTKRLLNETSPVTKRLRNKTSPRQLCNGLEYTVL
jgi:hypothetical protein